MKYGGTYGETWSMFENGGKCSGTDYSFVDKDMQPRSSYYHMQMISENFSGFYLDGTSNLDTVRAFGAVDPDAEKIAVMLLNIDATDSHTCMIRLDSSLIEDGACQINIPAGLAVELEQAISSQTSMVMVFNLQGQLIKTITYMKDADAPQTVIFP